MSLNSPLGQWRLHRHCGATKSFDWPATSITFLNASLDFDQKEWWQAAWLVLDHITEGQHNLSEGSQNAQKVDVPSAEFNTMAAAWKTLQAISGLPQYPIKYLTNKLHTPIHSAQPVDAQEFVFYTACPYEAYIKTGMELIATWLEWAERLMVHGQLAINTQQAERWRQVLAGLQASLPTSDLRTFHHNLFKHGFDWTWLDGDQTRIGMGDRQITVKGVPADFAYNQPERFRVPIYTVTGSVGKTTTARLLWQLLQQEGRCIALTASDGAWIGEHKIIEGDCIGGVSAQMLLRQPDVQAAVFEQGRGGIVKQGVPYAYSDVAILLNIQKVHLGLDGIETLEQMADTKAIGLRPARLIVLNRDDEQCQRIGELRQADGVIWFSVTASSTVLEALSKLALASLGVERGNDGEALNMVIWQGGKKLIRLPLEGVSPYHGLLTPKTLEELLAAWAAAWFGPLPHPKHGWYQKIRSLRLDSKNHAFRTSVHQQGNVIFVLDKAGEQASLEVLGQAINQLAAQEHCEYRLAVLCRSAGEHPDRHRESAASLHDFVDEFLIFDRPDSYKRPTALPIYHPGSIPMLLKDELQRLNAMRGLNKLISITDDWQAAERVLRERLVNLNKKILVLVNQPATLAVELNRTILAFATSGLAAHEQEEMDD